MLVIAEAHRSEVLIVAEAHRSEVLIVAEVDFVEASVLFEGGIVDSAAAVVAAAAVAPAVVVVAVVTAAVVAAAVVDFSFVGSICFDDEHFKSLEIFSGFELFGDEAAMAVDSNDDLLAVVVSSVAVAEVSVEL